ncbi:hypothetical protein KKC45_03595 [Patescibacteria group bacterium]|nr:hypothetical protein [Patescibacteria group bacterium]
MRSIVLINYFKILLKVIPMGIGGINYGWLDDDDYGGEVDRGREEPSSMLDPNQQEYLKRISEGWHNPEKWGLKPTERNKKF